MKDSIPLDGSTRKVILVLTQHEIDKCSHEQGAYQPLLDEEIYVLKWPLSIQGEVPQFLRNIADSRRARPGGVMIQNPFDQDEYVDVVDARVRLALDKHIRFSTLCMLLGAKAVIIKQDGLESRNGNSTFNLKGRYAGGSGQVKYEKEEMEKIRSQLDLSYDFEGGSPNIEAAEHLLHSTGLKSDCTMRSLVEMRRVDTNRILTHKLRLSLSNEANSSLSVAAKLDIPTLAFLNLSSDFEHVVKSQREYTLTVEVKF